MRTLVLWMACGGNDTLVEDCVCDVGHGVRLSRDEITTGCMCLAGVPMPDPPAPTSTFTASNPDEVDWAALDAALAEGPVTLDVIGDWGALFVVERTDAGPHRLTIDGHGTARIPGIRTDWETVVHRVTVRGIELTGSDDKGLYWRGGDDLVFEDLDIHANDGTPALMVDYANRSGHASTSIVVRNNHVYDQTGECIYIGGSEGTGAPAHAFVEVSGNLVHDCHHSLTNKTDGINVKDEIGEVSLHHNVVFHTAWGIEVASPGHYHHNLVFDTEENGIHTNDLWGPGLDQDWSDIAVFRAGETGMRLSADEAPADLRLDRMTVAWSGNGEALRLAGNSGLRVQLSGFRGNGDLFGWGAISGEAEDCALDGEIRLGDVAALDGCDLGPVDLPSADLIDFAGHDGIFFTTDDPWIVPGGAQAD